MQEIISISELRGFIATIEKLKPTEDIRKRM